jgi:hypothetical protein
VTTETKSVVVFEEAGGTATGDLHIHHAGGGSTDVKGLDGKVLNLHQAANASLNARFTFANFTLAPEDPRSVNVLEVHGSHLTDAYATFQTDYEGVPALVRVGFGGDRPRKARVVVSNAASGVELRDFDLWVGKEDGELAVGRVKIQVKPAVPVAVVLSNDKWEYTLVPGTYRTVGNDARHARIDVSVAALADPLAAKVAPHGLLGQGFDGLRIEGSKDNYVPDAHGIFVTSAQGEGAIEGTVSDYVVDRADPFSTDFKFSRFGAATAPPRDISKLNTPVGSSETAASSSRATVA